MDDPLVVGEIMAVEIAIILQRLEIVEVVGAGDGSVLLIADLILHTNFFKIIV